MHGLQRACDCTDHACPVGHGVDGCTAPSTTTLILRSDYPDARGVATHFTYGLCARCALYNSALT